jgi:Transposase
MAQVWAGVDTGKTHHHCVVIDHDSRRLLSRRVANDEQQLLALLAAVAELAGPTRSPGRSTRPTAAPRC